MTGNRSERMPLRDVRRVFRLVGEICELRDQPSLQRRRMIDGLCELIGLRAGQVIYLDRLTTQQWLMMMSRITGRSPARRSLQRFARWASHTSRNESPPVNGDRHPTASGLPRHDLLGLRERNLLRLLVVELYRVHRRGDPPSEGGSEPNLAPRQLQVLDGLLGGASVKRIAQDLGLSPRTVEEHTRVVYGRFGASSRAQLMALFIGGGSAVSPTSDTSRG